MVKKQDKERLSHMLSAIMKIEKYTEDISFNGFEKNEMLQDAIFKNLEIIGDAAYKLSDETKETYNHIEWKKIEGLRHRLVHDYYKVDLTIVWNTKNKSLPELMENINNILTNKE